MSKATASNSDMVVPQPDEDEIEPAIRELPYNEVDEEEGVIRRKYKNGRVYELSFSTGFITIDAERFEKPRKIGTYDVERLDPLFKERDTALYFDGI